MYIYDISSLRVKPVTIPTTLLAVQVSDLKEKGYCSIFCVKSSNTIYH